MRVAAKKLAGLRRYHADRPVKTRLKLLEALDRMESGHTVVVEPEFNWSKTTLAREAGVNINTVVRKLPGGGWAFPEINERFDELKQKRQRVVTGSDAKEEKIAELRNEVERLQEQNRLLAVEINRIGRQVLEERDRADRMAVYERQNASLRDEISRIQAGRSAPLRVVARHEY
jgi:predicted nuclease with TOPRIM domain